MDADCQTGAVRAGTRCALPCPDNHYRITTRITSVNVVDVFAENDLKTAGGLRQCLCLYFHGPCYLVRLDLLAMSPCCKTFTRADSGNITRGWNYRKHLGEGVTLRHEGTTIRKRKYLLYNAF